LEASNSDNTLVKVRCDGAGAEERLELRPPVISDLDEKVSLANCKYSKNNYQARHTSEEKVGVILKFWCNFTASSSGAF
jgi:hypothetical protein